jgi:hypothetical protein
MKLNELRKVIREEVKAAIQEELKDILLEAVRSPKPAITENLSVAAPQTKPDPEAQKAFRQQMLSQMAAGNGNMNLTTADTNTFRPSGPATAEGSALPEGNVGLDQIMGLMTNK